MGYYRQHAVDGLLQFAHTCEDLRLWRAVFAELFGTFIMVFVGLSNIVGSEYDTGVGKQIDNLVTPGLTFAAIIMTLIHIIGPTSGCHINPAVTISMMVVRRCHFVKGILYIAVQLIGKSSHEILSAFAQHNCSRKGGLRWFLEQNCFSN